MLYGLLTQESIGRVLVAGVLPGVLTAALLMLAAYLVARRNPDWAPRLGPRLAPCAGSRARTIWVVPAMFALSMGGLYLGVFTPTEAGAVGAFLAVGFGLATRRLEWSGFRGGGADRAPLRRAVPDPDGGTMFGYFLTLTRIPDGLARSSPGCPWPHR